MCACVRACMLTDRERAEHLGCVQSRRGPHPGRVQRGQGCGQLQQVARGRAAPRAARRECSDTAVTDTYNNDYNKDKSVADQPQKGFNEGHIIM